MRVLAKPQLNRKAIRVSTQVKLRECSVVIIGSKCRICGRGFKCETDVAVHQRWRHFEPLMGDLENILYMKNTSHYSSQSRCNIYGIETIPNLRIHECQIQRYRKKRRERTVKVIFKFNGIITTDRRINRKYLKMWSVQQYSVDISTQTEPLENERSQDNSATNIDLLLPDHATLNAVQCSVRPYKAANRYILGKSISTACSMVGKSLMVISNTPHRNAISDSNGSYIEYSSSCDSMSREDRMNTLIVDNVNIQNETNSRINTCKTRNAYYRSKISILNNRKISPACQQDESIDISSSPICKQHSGSSENLYHIPTKQFNQNANVVNIVNVVDVDVNGNDNSFDDIQITMKRSSTRFNDKNESTEVNANVDDDVQEVLRIMRGNIRNDINHESPNRIEREILLQSAINEICVFPTHRGSNFREEERSTKLTANDMKTSDNSLFEPIAEDSNQFLQDELNKKLNLCLKYLRHWDKSLQ